MNADAPPPSLPLQEHRKDPARSMLRRILPTAGPFVKPLKLVGAELRGAGAWGGESRS